MDLAGVNLNLMVALQALVEERSVTRAAQRTGVTQPSMSYSLQQLRRIFDDPLLVRGQGGLVLTPLAVTLTPRLEAGLRELQHVLEAKQSFDPQTSRRCFRVAASDYFQVVHLHRLLKLLAERAPAVDLVLRPHRHASRDALETGRLDFVAGSEDQAAITGLDSQQLFRERFVVIARKNHPQLTKRLTLARYCSLRHALVAEDEEPGYIDRRLLPLKRSRRIALRLSDYAGLGNVIAESDLIATVPERYAHAAAKHLPLEIRRVPLELPTFGVVLAWHPRFAAEPGRAWLRAQLVEAAASIRRVPPSGGFATRSPVAGD